MSIFVATALLFAQTAHPHTPPSFDAIAAQAAAARDANRMDEAVADYRKGLKLRPNWDEGWWNLGSITYDQNKFAECVPAFQRLTALKPDLSPAWIMSGLCEFSIHDYRSALKNLLRAEQLHFDGPPELGRAGRLELAMCLTKAGTFERAIVLLTELTRMDRKTPEISAAAGIAGLRRPLVPSEVPEADRDLVSRLGDAMSTAMELDQKGATEKFEAVLADYPAQPDIHFRFGAFLMQQAPQRGIEEIGKTLQLEPGHVPALVGLTMIYLKNDDPKSALEYAERAVTAGPGDFATHVALGRTLLATDDAARAADQLRIAVDLAPDSADAHYSLASAYSRLGRKEEAQREQEEFKRIRKLIDATHQ